MSVLPFKGFFLSRFHPDHLYQWVESFMDRHQLFPPSKRAVIAFSGGEDSVLLWHTLKEISKRSPDKIKELVAVHVEHGLRETSYEQACELGLRYKDLKIIRIKELPPSRDIEAWARRHRYEILKSQLNTGDCLYMGHHIDDSIEWYLRQLFAGSGAKLQMGIPLINGVIRRPFHCLTKKQISRFVKKLRLFHIQDESNDDLRFQRNIIRHKILSEVYDEFPKAQAHFVERANAWANSLYKRESEHPFYHLYHYGENITVIYCKSSKRWAQASMLIKKELERLSLENRGEFREPLGKMLRALDSKNGARGPYSFSGGVKVYAYAGMIIMTNPLGLADIRQWDREISLGVSQIPMRPSRLKKLDYSKLQGILPFALYRSEDFRFMGSKTMKGMKDEHLFPLTLAMINKEGLELRPISFLEKALAKKRKDALPVLFIKFDP